MAGGDGLVSGRCLVKGEIGHRVMTVDGDPAIGDIDSACQSRAGKGDDQGRHGGPQNGNDITEEKGSSHNLPL
jgi:hypothetical protein